MKDSCSHTISFFSEKLEKPGNVQKLFILLLLRAFKVNVRTSFKTFNFYGKTIVDGAWLTIDNAFYSMIPLLYDY